MSAADVLPGAVPGNILTPSSVPIPDPTTLTTDAVERSARAERQITDRDLAVLRERLDGIDRATELRLAIVAAIPGLVDEKILHLRELHEERFVSIATQFSERDTRAERESRDNKVAVDAAFAAQKEAAAKQDESNQKAIDKSEAGTNKTIEKLAELFATSNEGLASKIDDVKTAQAATQLLLNGSISNRQGGTETSAVIRAVVASAIGILLFLITIGSLIYSMRGKP